MPWRAFGPPRCGGRGAKGGEDILDQRQHIEPISKSFASGASGRSTRPLPPTAHREQNGVRVAPHATPEHRLNSLRPSGTKPQFHITSSFSFCQRVNKLSRTLLCVALSQAHAWDLHVRDTAARAKQKATVALRLASKRAA